MSVFVIAEAGVNHNGNPDLAFRLVDMAAQCGADAVKFQNFVTELNVSKNSHLAPYQKEAGVQATSQVDMLKQLELSKETFVELAAYCKKKGIEFISTPDDEQSVDLLVELGVRRIKIASAELNNLPFLKMVARKAAQTNMALILSTGMGTLEEVLSAVSWVREEGVQDLTVLHCTSNYPTLPAQVNLHAIPTLQRALGLPVGYSDHTTGSSAAQGAVALGATVVEKHITLDCKMEGPDHQASLEAKEFTQYVNHIREMETMLGDGLKRPTPTEKDMIPAMRRSIVTARPIAAGETLQMKDLLCKRPGTGISPVKWEEVLGRTTTRAIREDELVSWEDLR